MSKPLVPAHVDLTDFTFMPFEFARLFNSDTWALSNDAEKVAAITLWGKSWAQKPAGSLPADDRLLAKLSDMGPRWKRVKEMALRGWIECDDGRLYHPVVCVKALEAWLEKLGSRLSSGAGNAKRWGVEFDPSEIEASITEARTFLAALDPQSRHLTRKRPPGVPSGQKKHPVGSAVGIPPGSQETGTGIDIKPKSEREARAQAGTPEDDQLPTGVDPERWASYRDQLADDGKLSISRIKTALLQLRRAIHDGHNPNAVLEAAVMRGLRDLTDVASRLATEAGKARSQGPPQRTSSAPPIGKTAQALHALEAMKHGTDLDQAGNPHGLSEAPHARLGSDARR